MLTAGRQLHAARSTYGSGAVPLSLLEMPATKGAKSLLFPSADTGVLMHITRQYVF